MTSLSRKKGLTISLVVCYTLAVTASALFHNHKACESCCPILPSSFDGKHPLGKTSSTCDCHDHHHCSSEPSSLQPKKEDKDNSAAKFHLPDSPDHSGCCPVCSFLAQKTVTAEAPPEITWTALEKAQDPEIPSTPTLLSPYSWHGRAPPLVV